MRAIYCTGYWSIANNHKHTPEHYEGLLPKTMKLLHGQKLHLFFGDQETADRFKAEAERNQVDFSATQISIQDLPTYDDVLPILQTCENLVAAGEHKKEMVSREKMWVHLKRDYFLSGAEAFRSLLTVWTSKIFLLAEFSRSLPRGADKVNWVDASIAKFNGNRTNWNFLRQKWQPQRVGHYASPMSFHGDPLPLNASFMGAAPEVWPIVERLFREQLIRRAGDGYVHDEETIMSYVVADNPDLFQTLGRPVRGIGRIPLKVGSLLRSA